MQLKVIWNANTLEKVFVDNIQIILLNNDVDFSTKIYLFLSSSLSLNYVFN